VKNNACVQMGANEIPQLSRQYDFDQDGINDVVISQNDPNNPQSKGTIIIQSGKDGHEISRNTDTKLVDASIAKVYTLPGDSRPYYAIQCNDFNCPFALRVFNYSNTKIIDIQRGFTVEGIYSGGVTRTSGWLFFNDRLVIDFHSDYPLSPTGQYTADTLTNIFLISYDLKTGAVTDTFQLPPTQWNCSYAIPQNKTYSCGPQTIVTETDFYAVSPSVTAGVPSLMLLFHQIMEKDDIYPALVYLNGYRVVPGSMPIASGTSYGVLTPQFVDMNSDGILDLNLTPYGWGSSIYLSGSDLTIFNK